MKLYYKDTNRSYSDISNMLTETLGPSGPATWKHGRERTVSNKLHGYTSYVEIHADDDKVLTMLVLKW